MGSNEIGDVCRKIQDGTGMNKLLTTIPKNSSEALRVKLTEFQGYQLLSMRIWTKELPGKQEARPTRKGLAVQVDLIPELLTAIEKAAVIVAAKTET